MDTATIDAIIVTERVNGWWVTVRYRAGHEEHHGPYDDEATAEQEADLIAPDRKSPEQQIRH